MKSCQAIPWMLLYFSTAFLVDFAADAQIQKNVFIGVNGGESDYSNFSYFERDLSSFSRMMSAGGYHPLLLNAGGPNGRKLQIVDDLFPKRDSDGNLVLGQNSVQADSATPENIDKIIQRARSENPSSVVMLLRNHGSEKGMATWLSDEYLYKNIKEADHVFPPSTLVRRVNLFCYSGRAIAPLNQPKNFNEVLDQFPVNRCGFSSADVDEFATDKDGIETFLKQGQPSLKDLKNFYLNDPNYYATPRLSSDYMTESILHLVCDTRSKKWTCGFEKSALDSIELTCISFESGEEYLKTVSERVVQDSNQFLEIGDAKFRLIEKYLRQKYPSQAKLVDSYYSKIEANTIYKKAGRPTLQISEWEKQAYEFWKERLHGIDLKYGATKGLSYVWGLAKGNNPQNAHVDPSKLNQIYQKKGAPAASKYIIDQMSKSFDNKVIDPDLSDFTDWLFTSGSTVRVSGQTIEGWKILDLQEQNDKSLSENQRKRKELHKFLDSERSKFVDQILGKLPNSQLKERLDNLKKCETKPLASKS